MKRVQVTCCLIIICVLSACKSSPNTKSDTKVVNLPVVEYFTLDDDSNISGQIFKLYEDDEYRITIQNIDSTTYNLARTQYYKTPDPVVVIHSLDSIVDAISATGASIGVGQLDGDEAAYLSSIRFANGDSICYNEDGLSNDIWIVAYYPQYGMLEMEGGHSSVFGINVLTGKTMMEDGNPGTQTISPNKKFRFSDIYGGQECSTFIFQKIADDGSLIKLFDMDDFEILCSNNESFWADDYTLYCDSYYYRHKLTIQQKKD